MPTNVHCTEKSKLLFLMKNRYFSCGSQDIVYCISTTKTLLNKPKSTLTSVGLFLSLRFPFGTEIYADVVLLFQLLKFY